MARKLKKFKPHKTPLIRELEEKMGEPLDEYLQREVNENGRSILELIKEVNQYQHVSTPGFYHWITAMGLKRVSLIVGYNEEVRVVKAKP